MNQLQFCLPKSSRASLAFGLTSFLVASDEKLSNQEKENAQKRLKEERDRLIWELDNLTTYDSTNRPSESDDFFVMPYELKDDVYGLLQKNLDSFRSDVLPSFSFLVFVLSKVRIPNDIWTISELLFSHIRNV